MRQAERVTEQPTQEKETPQPASLRELLGGRRGAVDASLTAVVAGSLIALYTGRAQDFFLIQVLSNIASALAWAVSIMIRWPLLGVVVGTLLGQKARWR